MKRGDISNMRKIRYSCVIVFIIIFLPIFLNLEASDLNKSSNSKSIRTIQSNPSVNIEVNPNIELMSILLSINPYTAWFENFGVPLNSNYSYQDDINEWFKEERFHQAVLDIWELCKGKGVTFPLEFILHFSPPPNLILIYNYTEDLLPSGGEMRLNLTANHLRDFVNDSNFNDFFVAHKSFYNSIVSNFTSLNNWNDTLLTLENFFGLSKSNYTIVLAPYIFFGGGFGPYLEDQNDTHSYAIITTGRIQNNMPNFGNLLSTKWLVLHEFAHSFINPIVDANMDQLDRYSDLYEPVRDNLTQYGYSNWQCMIYETLVRAFTAWALTEEYGEEKGNEILDYEESYGFYFIRDIYDAYFEYMDKPNQYSSFDHFIPEIQNVLARVLSQISETSNLSQTTENTSLSQTQVISKPSYFVFFGEFLAILVFLTILCKRKQLC